MKRLTERDINGTAMAACCGENCSHNFCCENGGYAECGDMDDIIDRLAAYEDTGLEPGESDGEAGSYFVQYELPVLQQAQ